MELIKKHDELLHHYYVYYNIYNNKYYKQSELIAFMENTKVLNVKISYNKNFTIFWSVLVGGIYQIKLCDIISLHIIRILHIKKLVNIINININTWQIACGDIDNFLIKLNEIIDNFYDYCALCGSQLKILGLEKITCCENDLCNKMLLQVPIDNKLSKLFENDPKIFKLLPLLLKSFISHPKASKLCVIPKLPNVNNFNDYKGYIDLYLGEEGLNNLIKIFKSDFEKKNGRIINEIDLIKILGKELYSLVKIATTDNYFLLFTQGYLENIANFNLNIAKNVYEALNDKTMHLVKLKYSASVENSFNTGHYLYHGSSLCNWYSIIKNGLKVMSGTEFMTTGAVHGNGIYCSDLFSMSQGYSRKILSAYDGSVNVNIIGVFEFSINPHKYKKSNNIYVINDDKTLLLRYLIIVNDKFNQGNELDKYFKTNIMGPSNVKGSDTPILLQNYNITRLKKEYKLLKSNPLVIKMSENIDNILNLCFVNKTYGQINLQIIFNDYPINPPTIKYSDMNLKTVSYDYIIKIDDINPANWTITNNLTNIINKIDKYMEVLRGEFFTKCF